MALADFFVSLLTFVTVYSLFGLGLNVKYGFTGLIDFGHVAYFMIGAYVTVILTLPPGGGGTYEGLGGFGLPMLFSGVPFGGLLGWLLALALGMAAAAFVSLLVGIPTLRLREDYLAITALGIATILNSIVDNERWIGNGAFGIRDVYEPLSGAFPLTTGSFTLNLLVFGLPSVLVLGYLGYRALRVVRPLGLRTGAITTVAVGLLAGGFVALIAGGTLLLVGVALLAASVVVGKRAFTAADRVEPVLALAAVELFGLWYLVTPLVDGSLVDVFVNLVWLFDPFLGDTGGMDYDRGFFALTVLLLAGAYWWVQRTVNSPYGRVLRAVREDETVPEALGKPTTRYKIQSLMFGSALAGAAGGLWSVTLGFIDPTQFADTVTFFAFTAVIIGGTANNRGVVLGTTVFWVINSGTRFLDDYFPAEYAIQLAAARLMLIGSLLILILYYRPEGILGEQDYEVPVGDDAATATDGAAATDGGVTDD